MKYTYDSWGNIISVKDNAGNVITDQNNIGNINPYRYRSYRYDRETNLYYLQSRYYSPEWGRFINSDAFNQTATGTLLSTNMYAYCENNPINKCDPSGEIAWVIPIIWGIEEALKAIVATVITVGAIYTADKVIESAQSKATTTSKTKTTTTSPPKTNNTVYTLTNKNTNTVEYVGRTSRPPEIREAEHKLNIARANLTFNIYATNLTSFQARGLEQMLIEEYGTLNKTNPANNQRNGIAWDNPNINKYMNAASTFLSENETYVGP